MKILKDIFRVGRYRLTDGTIAVFTRQDVYDSYNNTRAMLEAGHAWTPPIIWEHAANEGPVPLSAIQAELNTDRNRRADFVRNTLGYPTGVQLKHEGGVPVLYAECEVPDDEDAEQWRRVGKCSACIKWDMKDSNGRKFPGASIFHIAATNKPVQMDQKSVSLSSLAPNVWTSGRTVYLAEKDMADEPNTPTGGTGKTDDLTTTKQLLGQLGYPIPDEVMDLPTLNISLKSHVLAKSASSDDYGEEDMDEPDGDEDPNANPNGSGSTTGQGFGGGAMLSGVAEGQRVLDAATRRRWLERLDKIEGYAATHGLRTPVELRKIRDSIESVTLSWGGDGLPKPNKAIRALVDVEKSVTALKNAKGNKRTTGTDNNPSRRTASLSAIAGQTEQELAREHAAAELAARGFGPPPVAK